MQANQQGDIEHNIIPHSSSSYGSLGDSGSSNLQRHTSSSSRNNGGLSMHVHGESAKSATSNASSATAAANYTVYNADDPATPTFGSDRFQNGSQSLDHDHNHQHNHPAHQEHLVKSRQYYRDMVLGVNDGLVSTFLLVAGVVGGGMDVSGVLLTAVSGAIAGAISMFAGEYVATKSQNEVMKGEKEMQELEHLLTLIGIPGSQPYLNLDTNETTAPPTNDANVSTSAARETRKLRRRLTNYYSNKPDALLKIMIALEFGIIDGEVRSPLVAGASSMALFFIGAIPSILPFVWIDDATMGLLGAGVACAIGLFIVGAVKTWATRGNM
ncbi:hypothetical protein ACHAXR_000836, partial [Thalassiosira sp. AJA248-18]